VIAVNLSASFHAIRTTLPQMMKRNWGRIINNASTHALVASEHNFAYAATKHGVLTSPISIYENFF
jgi:3-hydroxybutyrate dehydrogenase